MASVRRAPSGDFQTLSTGGTSVLGRYLRNVAGTDAAVAIPAGTTQMLVEMTAGGATGGPIEDDLGGSGVEIASGGGGGAAYLRFLFQRTAPFPATLSATVGAGGIALSGTDAIDGDPSQISLAGGPEIWTCNGGQAPPLTPTPNAGVNQEYFGGLGGIGGLASIVGVDPADDLYTINVPGRPGEPCMQRGLQLDTQVNWIPGRGGDTPIGKGGGGWNSMDVVPGGLRQNGAGFGGGGSGVNGIPSGSAQRGGNGSAGFILIEFLG